MREAAERMLIDPLRAVSITIMGFLPDLISALLLFGLGLIAAWLAKAGLVRLFRAVRMDTFSERAGVSRVIVRSGVREPFSLILARFVGFLVLLAFAIIALGALHVPAIETLLERFFLYLPNIFTALLILVFGSLFSNFFGRTALIAAVNAGVKSAGLIGRMVKTGIVLFSLALALDQLGIGRDTVTVAFALLFGGVVFALSLAFGLGGKDLAKTYLEQRVFCEKKEEDDIDHL